MLNSGWTINKAIKGAVLLAIVLALGITIGQKWASSKPVDNSQVHEKLHDTTIWTCSMHPQIRQPEPGKCPICGMDLIPAVADDAEKLGPRMMSMSEEAMRLAEVQTVKAERRFVDVKIPLVGKVAYDETRIKIISAWVPGRLDRLFVDYTGIPVRKGDHLVEIYSPELFSAQEELLQAIKAVKSLSGSESRIVRRSTEESVTSAREKLRLLGLSNEQVIAIEKKGIASASIQINAPVSGIVIHKNAAQGAYVKTGTPIYTLADLSTVWVMLDAYESDVAWLRYGQQVQIKTEAYGDRKFAGWISFIDPVLDSKTRTIKIRVIVDNSDGMLRPNMFASAVVKARVGSGGVVINESLKGKWISPMHPEVIKDHPGKCDVCGMPLVKAEDLGYTTSKKVSPPLVVPASAVLTTGKRAIVYVRIPKKERPTFEGIEVKVGPRAGDFYLILSGLNDGQEVITNGNFKIDSALQLLAKPSMMSPADKTHKMEQNAHAAKITSDKYGVKHDDKPMVSVRFLKELSPVYASYIAAQQALAKDNEKSAREAFDQLVSASAKVDMTLLQGKAHMEWMELSRMLKSALEHRGHMKGIDGTRRVFLKLSEAIVKLEKRFGHADENPHRIAFCPMANDGKGAEWLQLGETVDNPYYGAAMLRCGEIRQTIKATGENANE